MTSPGSASWGTMGVSNSEAELESFLASPGHAFERYEAAFPVECATSLVQRVSSPEYRAPSFSRSPSLLVPPCSGPASLLEHPDLVSCFTAKGAMSDRILMVPGGRGEGRDKGGSAVTPQTILGVFGDFE